MQSRQRTVPHCFEKIIETAHPGKLSTHVEPSAARAIHTKSRTSGAESGMTGELEVRPGVVAIAGDQTSSSVSTALWPMPRRLPDRIRPLEFGLSMGLQRQKVGCRQGSIVAASKPGSSSFACFPGMRT